MQCVCKKVAELIHAAMPEASTGDVMNKTLPQMKDYWCNLARKADLFEKGTCDERSETEWAKITFT
eukprot:12683519-Alexandrium_andersonii.AAC.1